MVDDLPVFGIGDGDGWGTVAFEPVYWCKTVIERARTFMAIWRKEESTAELRQTKREADEVNKVPFAPGITVGCLKRFRVAFIGLPTHKPLTR